MVGKLCVSKILTRTGNPGTFYASVSGYREPECIGYVPVRFVEWLRTAVLDETGVGRKLAQSIPEVTSFCVDFRIQSESAVNRMFGSIVVPGFR
jgi:hypothetical protein